MEDDSLYMSFLAGDSKAYDRLMVKYGDMLISYLKGYLYSLEDAEDLMIEAFARIMVKKPKIAEGNFKAYLYTVAHNLIYHFYKKDRRRKEFILDGIGEDPAYDAQIDDGLWSDEKNRIIRRCLERVGTEMREVLWLFYFDEMSYDQIASVTGASRKKVDNLLTRGRKKLKEELEKEGITDAYQ